jgi:hypothetical protein
MILAQVYLAIVSLYFAQAADPKQGPQQPVPYSHKQHVALGLKCAECHTNPDPGESMGIPASTKCMACHVSIAKDKPAIQKLAEAARAKKDLPWVRVYQIPSYVAFSHKTHLDAGAKCEKCHGQVAQRDVLFREGDITMGGCMNCHRESKASNDCGYCHELRQ